jgi:hypothetical protein
VRPPVYGESRSGLKAQAVEFDRLLKIVVALTLVCGGLAVAVAIIGAFMPMPLAGQLVSAFLDSFKLGMAAILGLIGGRSGHIRSR